MKEFTNRALCANYKKCQGLASLWLGHVVFRGADGTIYTHSQIEPNFWRCRGYVLSEVDHLVEYGCTVVSANTFACVPCSIPDDQTTWRF